MHNPRTPLSDRDSWLHGPDADPDPTVAKAVALVTAYQLGLLSDVERKSVEHRLATDRDFATLAAPMLFAARVMRCEGEQHRRAAGEAERVASLRARIEAERPRPGRRRFRIPPVVLQLAAGVVVAVVIAASAASAYASVLRARIPPVSVTFTNAPLSVVMAELRRRYHVDVQACDPGFRQDRVTMTLTDAPIDSVANVIGEQTLRYAHWKVPYTGGAYTLLFQPQPDLPRGWWYNLRLFARSFTYLGCHH